MSAENHGSITEKFPQAVRETRAANNAANPNDVAKALAASLHEAEDKSEQTVRVSDSLRNFAKKFGSSILSLFV